jgi:hypothetical protein
MRLHRSDLEALGHQRASEQEDDDDRLTNVKTHPRETFPENDP